MSIVFGDGGLRSTRWVAAALARRERQAELALQRYLCSREPILYSREPRRKDEDVVFLHTGGAPALFAYQSALGI